MECEMRMGEFLSSDSKTKLVYGVWDAGGRKAIVHIVHGMCEHIGRYDDFARRLAKEGYVVCAHNHIGHGQSAGSDGELGYFGDCGGYEHLIDDVHLMALMIKSRYEGLPYVVFGHSMGSFITRNYLAKYPGEAGAALISGTSGANPAAGLVIAIAKVQKFISGGKKRSMLINNLTGKIYLKRIPNARTPYDWISTDDEIVDKYANDKYCTYVFTVSAYIDLMTLLNKCNSREWYRDMPKDIPLLLVSGKEDPVGNYGSGVAQVYNNLCASGAKNVEMKLYDGMRHEVLNERGREEVYKFIINWLENAIVNQKFTKS